MKQNKKVTKGPYKGARDFYPEDKQLQKWMFDKWRIVAERYGYQEYDSPILEPTELFLMKGNEEIVNDQTYTFKDRGDRSVTVRTEMTPSVSRMIAGRRQELAYPARWYSIPNLWRYERPQRGRLREFWQLNVDIFGVSGELAELEMIQIVDDLFQEFGAKRSSYTIKINSRVLINKILTDLGLDKECSLSTVRLIDKIGKMPKDEFIKKLDDVTKSGSVCKKLIKLLDTENPWKLPDEYRELQSVIDLKNMLNGIEEAGITNVEFDLSLMRGFDYYTDIVFEVFDTNPKNNRSLFGGGRYDGLIGQFGVEPVPTVGFGMGDVTFMDFLTTNKLLPELATTTDVTVLIKDEESISNAQAIARELRESGINTSVDFTGRKIDKQLKMAVKSGVRFVLFVGSDDTSKYTLKDLKSGKEQKQSITRVTSIIKDTK